MPVYKRNPKGNIVKDDEEGCWFYDFVIEGRRYKKALKGIHTRAKAEKIEEKKRFAVYSGDDLNNLGKTPFKQFVDEVYLPYQKLRIRAYDIYKQVCRAACAFFKNKTLREIENNPNLIERFMNHRLNGMTRYGNTRNPVTVNRDMGVISGIFTLAVKRRYCKFNPCRSVDRLPVTDSRRTAVLTTEDEIRLLEALNGEKEKFRPVVILGFQTGMRLSEILNLKWDYIDLVKGELTLPGRITKNKKTRTLPLNSEAVNVLMHLRQADCNASRVFPDAPGSGFSLVNVSKTISKICDQIGVPDATMHATRRTFNTRLIERNINPMHVKELMGHSSLDMTEHYTQLSRTSLREAVKTLENHKDDTVFVPKQ